MSGELLILSTRAWKVFLLVPSVFSSVNPNVFFSVSSLADNLFSNLLPDVFLHLILSFILIMFFLTWTCVKKRKLFHLIEPFVLFRLDFCSVFRTCFLKVFFFFFFFFCQRTHFETWTLLLLISFSNHPFPLLLAGILWRWCWWSSTSYGRLSACTQRWTPKTTTPATSSPPPWWRRPGSNSSCGTVAINRMTFTVCWCRTDSLPDNGSFLHICGAIAHPGRGRGMSRLVS